MNSLSFAILLIGSVALLVEGLSSTLSRGRSTTIGLLNLCLGIMGILFAVCIRSGSLVLAPEFGALMVQGAIPVLFTRIALVGVAVLPVLCLQQTATRKYSRGGWATHALIGMALGLWAAARLTIINPSDPVGMQVLMYDVWLPGLVVWLTYCFVTIGFSLTKRTSSLWRFGVVAACVSGMARFALTHQELSDPQSRPLWSILEVVALAAFCGLLGAGLTAGLRLQQAKFIRWLLGLTPGAIAVAAGALTRGRDLNERTVVAARWVLWAVCLYVICCLVVLARRRSMARAQSSQSVPGDMPAERPDPSVTRAKWHHATVRATLWLSLVVTPIFLLDLLSVGDWPRSVDFGGLLTGWVTFSAVLAVDDLDHISQTMLRIAREHPIYGLPRLQHVGQWVITRPRRLVLRLRTLAKGLSSGSGWELAFRSALLAVGALIVVIAIGESSDFNKLVVEPLTWSGKGEDVNKLAPRISEGVIQDLHDMRRDMLPVLLLSPSTSLATTSGQAPGTSISPIVLHAVLDTGAVQAALGKSEDIKLGKVVIPLSILVEPVQSLVRRTLNIHAVSGTLYTNENSSVPLIFLHSDRGDSWRVPTGSQPDPGPSAQMLSDSVGYEPEAWVCKRASGTSNPIDDVVREASFDIASSDPSFVGTGMTRSWPVYTEFREGLASWSLYRATGSLTDLNRSIACFSAAFRDDNSFVLAEYRAGVSLEAAGEVNSALQAFDACLHINPSFVQAESARAEALSTVNSGATYRPAIADIISSPPRTDEARRAWAAVLSAPDTAANRGARTAAYLGLCTHPFALAARGDSKGNKFYVNYYYCSRAEALLDQLPESARGDPEHLQLEAVTLFNIGETLNYHDYTLFKGSWAPSSASGLATEPHWLCGIGMIAGYTPDGGVSAFALYGSNLSAHALRYYNRALILLPNDAGLRCTAATTQAYVERDAVGPMSALGASADAHSYLAGEFEQYAQEGDHSSGAGRNGPAAEFFYRQAAREYLLAEQISPSDFDALNNFAYVMWQWWLDARVYRNLSEPSGPDLQRAEKFAREAVRLCRWRQDVQHGAIAEDTLGEILIAEGKNHEAIGHLRLAAVRNDGSVEGEEVLWDLAQALACDAASEGKDARSEAVEAGSWFQKIGQEESVRQFQPLTETNGTLDPRAAARRCYDER